MCSYWLLEEREAYFFGVGCGQRYDTPAPVDGMQAALSGSNELLKKKGTRMWGQMWCCVLCGVEEVEGYGYKIYCVYVWNSQRIFKIVY